MLVRVVLPRALVPCRMGRSTLSTNPSRVLGQRTGQGASPDLNNHRPTVCRPSRESCRAFAYVSDRLISNAPFSQIDAELHASGLSLDEIHSAKALIRRHAEANLDVGRARQSTTSRSEPIFKPRPVGNIFKRDLEDARRRQRDERLLRGQNRSIHTSHLALKQLHKKKSAPATSQRIEYKTAESALSTESQTFLAGSGEGLGILSERWDRLDMLEAEARAMGDLTLRGEVKQGALVECRR